MFFSICALDYLTEKSGKFLLCTLTTSAPMEERMMPVDGRAMIRASSTILIPANGRLSRTSGKGVGGVGAPSLQRL